MEFLRQAMVTYLTMTLLLNADHSASARELTNSISRFLFEPSSSFDGFNLMGSGQINEFEDFARSDTEGSNNTVNQFGSSSPKHRPSCQLVHVAHLLHHIGCQPKAIASFACKGTCSSYVQTSTSKFWQHERSCSCCQQTGLKEATFTLDCPELDPPYKKVKTHAPVDCLCRACTDLAKEDLRPQELVEVLSGNSGETTQ